MSLMQLKRVKMMIIMIKVQE
ncbi:hypothetical protein TNIN_440541, partial [Trichonephila inaurata madagascariensis]